VAVRRLARFERRWPARRSAAFLAGLLVIEIAACSSLAGAARSDFTLRVVQLMLLIDLAPTLLALGAPIGLALQAAPRRPRRVLTRALSSRLLALLTHPAVALVMMLASTYAFFLTPLSRIALADGVVMAAVEAGFFAVGCLFWWQAVGPGPMPNRMADPLKLLYLGATIPPAAFLGISLLDAARPAPGSTLADTHVAGAVLWSCGDLYTLGVLGIVFVGWMHSEQHASSFDPVVEAERIVAAAADSLVEHGEGWDDGERS
jgi:putative copper resistance protein D